MFAIKGDKIHGADVISTLQMFGATNEYKLDGGVNNVEENDPYPYYYIESANCIVCALEVPTDYVTITFTIQEFKKKYPFEVGDVVVYKHNKQHDYEVAKLCWYEGEVMFGIKPVHTDHTPIFVYVNDILCPEDIKEENNVVQFTSKKYPDKIRLDLGTEYELVQEDGVTYAVKKHLKLPTSYEDCCTIVNMDARLSFHLARTYYNKEGNTTIMPTLSNKWHEYMAAFETLRRMIICRDAYWKILNDWEPNWHNKHEIKYVIVNSGGIVANSWCWTDVHTFAFPTQESRDKFLECFKDKLEICKNFIS